MERIIEFVRQKTYSYDGSHDVDHALRVAWNAYRVCSRPRLRLICTAAALTHDTCDHKYVDDKEASLKELCTFLTSVLGEQAAHAVVAVVREVSYSKLRRVGPPAHLPEDLYYVWSVVADADMLEAMGCVGLMRTIMYQGSNNHSLDKALSYARDHLTRCVGYMSHALAVSEANRRRDDMLLLLGGMQKAATPDRNVGHHCLSSGSRRDTFAFMLDGLRTKRFWGDLARNAFEREMAWSASSFPGGVSRSEGASRPRLPPRTVSRA